MKQYKRVVWMLLVCMLAGTCMGCGESAEPEEIQSTPVPIVSMEDAPVIQYEIPQVKPNIPVNLIGYDSMGEKEILVKGSALPAEFVLMDAATEREVYRGAIEDLTYHEDVKLYTGLINITDYTEEGTYYLQCDKIGLSLPFSIEKGMYHQMFSEIYQEMITCCRDNTAAVSDIMNLLTAYEWYPEVFPDEDGDEIPDVMETVAEWIRQRESSVTDEGGAKQENEDVLYLAALAKFGYLYQKFDWAYATECMQNASAVFSKSQAPVEKDADYFYALAELYRATGLYPYRAQIQDYASFFEGNSSYLEEASYRYGAMTYLVTRRRVDVALGSTFMGDIMDRGEEVFHHYEELLSPLAAQNNAVEDLQEGAVALLCCNYVLHNYEYTHIIEEFLHYLCGRNYESECFYPEEGDLGRYLLLLSELTARGE